MKHQKEYEKRIMELRKVVDECEKKLPLFPKGNLRIARDGKRIKYFLISEMGDTHGTYIRKKDVRLAEMLAKKDYYEKVRHEASRELAAMEAFVKRMSGTSPEEIYDQMNVYRQDILSPLILSDREYAKQWQAEQYQGNPFNPEELIYDTNRGEKVRSKTEARIADLYYELGIPYRYEYPVKLWNGKAKYPDFALLMLPERKIIYHEHMGRLEDDDYRRTNLIKLQDYGKSGIFLGDNLIVTYETDYAPLNMKDLRSMLTRIFLKA